MNYCIVLQHPTKETRLLSKWIEVDSLEEALGAAKLQYASYIARLEQQRRAKVDHPFEIVAIIREDAIPGLHP